MTDFVEEGGTLSKTESSMFRCSWKLTTW